MGLEQRLAAIWRQPHPAPAAQALRPLSWLYGGLAGLHRGLYAAGMLAAGRAPRPLLVVGNLVAGGAGKTPTVIALADILCAQGHRVGIVSRGHGRQGDGVALVDRDSKATEVGDEPLLLHLRTRVPVAVGADRLAAAQALCSAHPDLTLLLSDDGLQHHRLAHDLAVIVFDDRGAGNGLLLPAGPLRQPLPPRVPANTLVLYTGGRPSTALPGFIGQRRLAGVLPLADWWAGSAPQADIASLRDRPLLAAAGLARPEAFFDMLTSQGLSITGLPLPDHARFDPLPWPAGTAEVIVTEKDAVKLRPGTTGGAHVWVARLDFQPEPGFADALRGLCAPYLPHP